MDIGSTAVCSALGMNGQDVVLPSKRGAVDEGGDKGKGNFQVVIRKCETAEGDRGRQPTSPGGRAGSGQGDRASWVGPVGPSSLAASSQGCSRHT